MLWLSSKGRRFTSKMSNIWMNRKVYKHTVNYLPMLIDKPSIKSTDTRVEDAIICMQTLKVIG